MKYVVDLETVSTEDLGIMGAFNYARHPNTSISVFGFKRVGSKETYSVVNPQLKSKVNSKEDIDAFRQFLNEATILICHNAPFERVVMDNKLSCFVRSVGFASLRMKDVKFIDTLPLANTFRSPAKLMTACKYFKLSELKDATGNAVMKRVSRLKEVKPSKSKTTVNNIPATWVSYNEFFALAGKEVYAIMDEYCKQDVKATEQLFLHLSKLAKKDLGTFLPWIKKGLTLTEKMNDGINLDLDFLSKLTDHLDNHLAKASAFAQDQFGVKSLACRKKILEFLNGKGYKIQRLGKDDIRQAIENNPDKAELNKIMGQYVELNKASILKLKRATNEKTCFGTIVDMFKFSGAYTTGRWSSYGVQLHNLPKPSISFDRVMEIKKGAKTITPAELVSCIRAMFVPSEDKLFFIADLKNIELKVALHAAGYIDELHKLKEGHDLYIDMAEQITKKKVKKGDKERDIGKEVMLACQFGMWANLFKENLSVKYNLEITESEAVNAIKQYRKKYKNIVAQWDKYDKELKKAAFSGRPFRVQLATGRVLDYGKLSFIHARKYIEGAGAERYISSGQVKQDSKGMYIERREMRYYDGLFHRKIYGSLVFQNKTQGEARDILLMKMADIDEQGFKIAMSVHDECVIEVEKSAKLDDLNKIWDAAGGKDIERFFPNLPLSSDCVILDRYFSH